MVTRAYSFFEFEFFLFFDLHSISGWLKDFPTAKHAAHMCLYSTLRVSCVLEWEQVSKLK